MGFIIRRMGRSLTAVAVIIALIMCIPGIVLLSLSSTIYGDHLSNMGVTLGTTVGASVEFKHNGLMTEGNNYDIHISISVSAIPSNPPSSSVTVRMTIDAIGEDLTALPSMKDFQEVNFNNTVMTQKYELKEDLGSTANVNFTFETMESVSLTSMFVEVTIYENPRRVLSDIATWLGLILLIPGGVILIGVACLTGRRRR